MSTLTQTPPAAPRAKARRRRWPLQGRLLAVYTWLVIIWLFMPIGVMILFGFNNPRGRYNNTWQGFTLKWYG
ncbi:MAG: transporter permease, partial [Streptosporangiaceae bacterium]|nr:transporter permease [Streptosporangiaceae bacterium]